jgi:hypothetical protein
MLFSIEFCTIKFVVPNFVPSNFVLPNIVLTNFVIPKYDIPNFDIPIFYVKLCSPEVGSAKIVALPNLLACMYQTSYIHTYVCMYIVLSDMYVFVKKEKILNYVSKYFFYLKAYVIDTYISV